MEHQFYKIGHDKTTALVICDKRGWIATAIGLAGSVASSIFGGSAARKAKKKALEEQKYRANAEKAWYDKAYNTDYLDTKAGQNLLRRAQEVQDEYVRKADGAKAVGGGTDASVAQAKEAANKTIGDAVASIGAKDADNKRNIEQQHLNNVMQQSVQREQAENQRASDITTAAQGASNAIMTVAGSLEGAGKSLKTNKIADDKGLLGNKNVTSVGKYLEHKTNAKGLINPITGNRFDAIEDAAKKGLKQKPNVPYISI